MKKTFWLFGANLTILESIDNALANFDLTEWNFPLVMKTPVRVHSRYLKTPYAILGELSVYAPANNIDLSDGDSYYIPVNTSQAVVNNSTDTPFGALVIAALGGFAKLINTTGEIRDLSEKLVDRHFDIRFFINVCQSIGDNNISPPGTRP